MSAMWSSCSFLRRNSLVAFLQKLMTNLPPTVKNPFLITIQNIKNTRSINRQSSQPVRTTGIGISVRHWFLKFYAQVSLPVNECVSSNEPPSQHPKKYIQLKVKFLGPFPSDHQSGFAWFVSLFFAISSMILLLIYNPARLMLPVEPPNLDPPEMVMWQEVKKKCEDELRKR